jgi:hypothetical protein
MDDKRQEKIAKRRADMPAVHRANYDLAVSGKSRKAAIKAFCLECVQWEKEEVRLCTALACPLYAFRPYKASKDCDNQPVLEPESKNAEQAGDN